MIAKINQKHVYQLIALVEERPRSGVNEQNDPGVCSVDAALLVVYDDGEAVCVTKIKLPQRDVLCFERCHFVFRVEKNPLTFLPAEIEKEWKHGGVTLARTGAIHSEDGAKSAM